MSELILPDRAKDLSNQEFGYLTVICYAGNYRKRVSWLCFCRCGNSIVASSNSIKTGNTTKCRYTCKYAAAERLKTNVFQKPEYRVWTGIRKRCNNEKCDDYPDYGGRGITICERWNDFKNFYEDMGPRPSKKHSIERDDVNGNYCPENCRWATNMEQANNRRNNRVLDYKNQSMTVSHWACLLKMNPYTLYDRLDNGWSVEKALTTPVKGTKCSD